MVTGQALRCDDVLLHGPARHRFKRRCTAGDEGLPVWLREAQDETLLVQTGDHVAVEEDRRVAEHLPLLDARAAGHGPGESVGPFSRGWLPLATGWFGHHSSQGRRRDDDAADDRSTILEFSGELRLPLAQ